VALGHFNEIGENVCDNCGGDLPDTGYVLVAWRGTVWACCTRACARSLLDDDQRFTEAGTVGTTKEEEAR